MQTYPTNWNTAMSQSFGNKIIKSPHSIDNMMKHHKYKDHERPEHKTEKIVKWTSKLLKTMALK